jgi:predicted nucleotidyltransferase
MTDYRLLLPENLLETIAGAMRLQGLDFFIVGATARDINLAHFTGLDSPRTTEDLDIAVRVASIYQFQSILSTLMETGAFTRIADNPIRLMYNNSFELDLLPFGDLETESREVHIPVAGGAFVLSVPGLEEVQATLAELKLSSGSSIQYCPLEGLVLLKLISWHEKPERTKDRDDIEHICKVYFDYAGDEIFESAYDLLHTYQTTDLDYQTLVASHYLGRKVRNLFHDDALILRSINEKLGKYDGCFRALLRGINDKGAVP